MRQKINEETYPFDQAAVQYSKLTDEEAKEQRQKVIDRIREIKGRADIGEDPRLIFELRELYSSLAWYRANKNRSRFFRIDTLGPSMRRATRHPDGRGFKRN